MEISVVFPLLYVNSGAVLSRGSPNRWCRLQQRLVVFSLLIDNMCATDQ